MLIENRLNAEFAGDARKGDFAEDIDSVAMAGAKVYRKKRFSQAQKFSMGLSPEVTAWQNRPLETVYSFVFLDVLLLRKKLGKGA